MVLTCYLNMTGRLIAWQRHTAFVMNKHLMKTYRRNKQQRPATSIFEHEEKRDSHNLAKIIIGLRNEDSTKDHELSILKPKTGVIIKFMS